MKIAQIGGYDFAAAPQSQAIINRIMSRSAVRYLILSNGKKSPPMYANAVFAVLGETPQRCQEVQSLRKVNELGGG